MEVKKNDLIKIPQDSFLYEFRDSPYSNKKFIVPTKKVEKPELGIYLKCLDEDYSEIILGDKIFIASNLQIFLYKEERNAN